MSRTTNHLVSARQLGILCLTAMIGLVVSEAAHANLVPARLYSPPPPQADSLYVVYKLLRNKFCPQFDEGVPFSQLLEFHACLVYVRSILLRQHGLDAGVKSPRGSMGVKTASTPNSGTIVPGLSSSTPTLPFLGNRLVLISAVPNAAITAEASALYSVGLRVQTDCSLDADLMLSGEPAPITPNGSLITTIPNAQDYLHQLSGLTTTPDVFAGGCSYPIQGQPSSGNFVLLGETVGGAVYGATAPSSLIVAIADPVANTFTSTTLLSSNANQIGRAHV